MRKEKTSFIFWSRTPLSKQNGRGIRQLFKGTRNSISNTFLFEQIMVFFLLFCGKICGHWSRFVTRRLGRSRAHTARTFLFTFLRSAYNAPFLSIPTIFQNICLWNLRRKKTLFRPAKVPPPLFLPARFHRSHDLRPTERWEKKLW